MVEAQVAVRHPLIDATGDGWVENWTNIERVGLTGGRLGLLETATRAGSRVLFVAPPGATVTFPLLAALRATGCDWVVRTDGRFFSPSTGRFFNDTASSWTRGPDARPTVEPVRIDTARSSGLVPAVQFSVSVHHRAAAETRLGRVVELLAEATAGKTPLSWGVTEPLLMPWDRDRLTTLVRTRAPQSTRVFASGPGFSATILVTRSETGLTEETRFLVPLEPADRDVVVGALRSVAESQRALFGMAYETISTADAAIPSVHTVPPVAIASIVGAAAVREIGAQLSALEGRARVEKVGQSRTPTVIVSVSSSGYQAQKDFARAADALGIDTIAELLQQPGRN